MCHCRYNWLFQLLYIPIVRVTLRGMEKSFSPKQLPSRLQAHPIFVMIMLLKTARRLSNERYGEKPKGVHMPHYAILAMLDEHETLSQKQISQMIDTNPSDIVDLIDALEDAGMVVRSLDKHDRRRHSLHITDNGRAELAKLDVKTAELNDILLAPLTPLQRQQFEEYLYRLLKR